MNVKLLHLIVLCSLLNVQFAIGQRKLVLQHQKNPHRTKVLKLRLIASIKTMDSTYVHSVHSITDSSFVMKTLVKTARDTVYIDTIKYTTYSKSNFFRTGVPKDTTIIRRHVNVVYKPVFTEILFSDITHINRYRYYGEGWGMLGAWMIIGAGLNLVLLPVAAIDDGKSGVKDWAIAEGAILGIAGASVGIAAIGRTTKRVDLDRKWKIKSRDNNNL